MSIGRRLREEREALGLSQPKFAAIAGTTKQTLFSWETDKTAPSASHLAAFSAAGVDVVYLLTGQRMPKVESTLNDREREIIELMRRMSEADRLTLYRTATALAATTAEPPAAGDSLSRQ